MLAKTTIFFIAVFAECRSIGRFRASSDGWRPLLHPPVQHKISNFGFAPESNGNGLYVTLRPRTTTDTSTSFHNNLGKGNGGGRRVALSENSVADLEALIDKKIGKSLESFFTKFNKMLEMLAINATKNIHIHHSGVAEAGNEGVPQQLRNTGTANYTAEDGDTEPAPRETSSGIGSYHGSFGSGTNSLETDYNYRRSNLSIDNVAPIKPTNYDESQIRARSVNISNHNFSKTLSNQNFFNHKSKAEPRLTTYNIEVPKSSVQPTVKEVKSNTEKAASSMHAGTRVAKSAYPHGSTSHYRTFDRGYNSLEQTPPDPFVALFLSHYGKYLPNSGGTLGGHYNNLYSYLASNNLHNNKPFGSYKIYEDTDG